MEKYCKLCKAYGHSHTEHSKSAGVLYGGTLPNGMKW